MSAASEMQAAYEAWVAADDAWMIELRRQFGKRAGDIRYTAEGRGAVNTELHRLYEAFTVGRKRWEIACSAMRICKPTCSEADL